MLGSHQPARRPTFSRFLMSSPKMPRDFVKQSMPTFSACRRRAAIGLWPRTELIAIAHADVTRPLRSWSTDAGTSYAGSGALCTFVDILESGGSELNFPKAGLPSATLWAFVPFWPCLLLREGAAIGAILIRRTEVRPFSDEADQASGNLRRSSRHRHPETSACSENSRKRWNSKRRRVKSWASSPVHRRIFNQCWTWLRRISLPALCDFIELHIDRVEGDVMRRAASQRFGPGSRRDHRSGTRHRGLGPGRAVSRSPNCSCTRRSGGAGRGGPTWQSMG